MIWTRYLGTLVLAASVSRFGHSRALPAIARTCDGDVCNNLRDVPANLLPRFDEIQDHDFNGFTTLWSKQEDRLLHGLGTRAVHLKLPDEPDPINPGKPKSGSPGTDPSNPDSPPTDPENNPSAGLDPTKPGSTSTTPANNPEEGLDPTKPKPSEDPSPSPSTGSDPANSVPKPAPDDNENPAAQPSQVADAAGCGLKRADEPCPGPSDNIGDDVPGQAPDTVAPTRSNRPVDDNAVEYDYLDEVQRERGTGLVNDKLANLQSRIANNVPDDPVRTDEINSKFIFDSKQPLDASIPSEYDSVFDPKLDHKPFEGLLKEAGMALTDAKGEREALRSKGATEQTLIWSWSRDQKVSFTDWSYKMFDTSDMSPKAHYTELTMALFKEKGVDPKKIEAIAQTRISNKSTEKTINSIFESLDVKQGTNVIVLSRSDKDQAKAEAFDAYFRTANGKGTVNLLAFHANDWGFRSPQTLVLQRTGLFSSSCNSLVTLG